MNMPQTNLPLGASTEFEGLTALVTGVGTGLGEAIAEQLFCERRERRSLLAAFT